MSTGFQYDVFFSHSSKDKAVVRLLAERLRTDGLMVWFDELELLSSAGAGEGGCRPGEGRGAEANSIPTKIEDGLEHSRALPLAHRMGEGARRAGEGCISAHGFGSEWAQLEAGTFRFRDPLNQECRFISLRLDDACHWRGRTKLPLPHRPVIR